MPLIAFVSPKGGVGKTTLAANTAHEFARRGQRVVALDLDPQNALGMHFGADPYERAGFITTLKSAPDPRRAWQSTLQRSPSGIALLPHGHATFAQSFAISSDLAEKPGLLLEPLRDILQDPEIVMIVDTPPGPSVAASILTSLIDFMVVVLLADAASVVQLPKIDSHGLYRTVSGTAFPADRIGFVVNQIDMRSRLSRAAADAAERHLAERLLGRVYRDEHVPEALARQTSVMGYAPGSKAAQDMDAIVDKIIATTTGPDAARATATGSGAEPAAGMAEAAAPASRPAAMGEQ